MSLAPSSPASWLADAARRWPGGSALLSQGRQWTFYALHAEARGRVAGLSSMGLRWGEPIAVISARAQTLATTLYTALAGGSPMLPLRPDADAAARLLRRCRIRQVVCAEGAIDLPGHVDCFPPGLPAERESAAHCVERSPETAQLLVATSGTTGEPRVAMLSGRALAASVDASVTRLDLRPGDVWLDCISLHHIGGLAIPLRCLFAGACVLLHEGFDAARVWEDLRRAEATHVSLVPAMLWRLLEHCADRPAPASLRTVLLGGGPVAGNLLERAWGAGWPVCVSYGMTETASHVTLSCAGEPDWPYGGVGRPLPGVCIDVVGPSGEPVDGAGRIRIKGSVVMSGYREGDAQSGSGLESDGAFLTGDVGRLDPRGRLQVLGRADDVLVTGGSNVHPAEVEEQIMRCPRVRDVAVTARSDQVWGQVLVALVSAEATAKDVLDWSRANLRSSIRPREVYLMDTLPRSELGKLDRGALREIAQKAAALRCGSRRTN